MIPIIDDFILHFNIKDFVVVADSGLLNKTNVDLLRQAGYKYILGARIKKEPADIVEWMLAQEKVSGTYHEYYRKNGERLIVGYSEQRAKKDAHNREKGIERLRKAYSSGVLTKASINRRGYNKFLTISKDVQVVINEQEIENDAKWDGLKGYVTNTDLDAEQVVAQYHSLWYVERAFRITKGNLEARPIFHFTEKRIEAHICICFIAYKVYKELQRIIALHGGINLSVDKVIDIAKTIPTIKLSLPYGDTERVKTLFLTEKHQRIKPLFDIKAILDKKQN
jgi:transposase